MEPLVHATSCPNCARAILVFKTGTVTTSKACGFEAEASPERTSAFDRFQGFLSDPDVIFADPVRMGTTRWVVAHTRMLLV